MPPSTCCHALRATGVRFLCSVVGDCTANVRVSDDNLIVISATLAVDGPVEASIAVGPESNCAGRITAGNTHIASTAPDPRSFAQVLKSELVKTGVRCQ